MILGGEVFFWPRFKGLLIDSGVSRSNRGVKCEHVKVYI